MECNKDEATRAKEISEKKFMAKDVAGAKKFALKAQNLYPGLDGIPQLLATLDIYVSAQNIVNGEPDRYAILGIDPKADDETVRKQYRKLALMLHPDKNKSVGADGAFKLISEAWSLLSDKTKRFAYDQKMKIKVSQQNVPPPTKAPTGGANGFYNFTKTKSTAANVKAQKNTSKTTASAATPPPHKPKANTFWTVCHGCKMHYEYLRVYLNHKLLCPNCHEPFLAVELAPPPTKSSTTWDFSEQQQNSNHQAANKKTVNSRSISTPPNMGEGGANASDAFENSNFKRSPFSRTPGTSSAAQAATLVQQAYEKVKRERELAQAATKRAEAQKRKNNVSKKSGTPPTGVSNVAKRRKGMDGASLGNHRDNANHFGTGTSVSNVAGSRHTDSATAVINGSNKVSITREVSQADIQNMLMIKARAAIRKKLSEWNSINSEKPSVKKANNENNKNKQRDGALLRSDEGKKNVLDKPVLTASADKSFHGNPVMNSDAEMIESMSIDVPDPDFHDFDKDRTERSFHESQVWAAYDDEDGMPRYYALIQKVVSVYPFEVKISWLNSKTNSEFGPLDWVGSGFLKTCGDFRVGRHELNKSLNSFSHKVWWSKGTNGVIRIYPRKGDVWALYRNWSPDWNELTADEVIHKYDMMEVLEDYDEELGVTVTPLVKVAGFKAVFHQHLDPSEIKRIPREEMFRFSHQVPSYQLTGQEATNAPKGCRELDPAATPFELLEVIPVVKEEDIVDSGANVGN